MTKPFEPRTFRSSKVSVIATSITVGILFGLFLFSCYSGQGLKYIAFYAATTLMAIIGLLQEALVRVTIKQDSIGIKKGFKWKHLQREKIDLIHAAKGCPVILVMKDGTKEKLPSLNITPLGLSNIVRPWLKRIEAP